MTQKRASLPKPKRVRGSPLGKKWDYDYLPLLMKPGHLDKLDALWKWSGKNYSKMICDLIEREFELIGKLTPKQAEEALRAAGGESPLRKKE